MNVTEEENEKGNEVGMFDERGEVRDENRTYCSLAFILALLVMYVAMNRLGFCETVPSLSLLDAVW